jgi:hypothetical protein
MNCAVLEAAQQEIAKISRVPTIEEVRIALASIPGSLSEEVVKERGDY